MVSTLSISGAACWFPRRNTEQELTGQRRATDSAWEEVPIITGGCHTCQDTTDALHTCLTLDHTTPSVGIQGGQGGAAACAANGG